MSTTTMPSSLEIAQAATLRPIDDVADELGLEHDEVEPYGRYKAKVDLSVIDRLAERSDAKLAEPIVRDYRAMRRALRTVSPTK